MPVRIAGRLVKRAGRLAERVGRVVSRGAIAQAKSTASSKGLAAASRYRRTIKPLASNQ